MTMVNFAPTAAPINRRKLSHKSPQFRNEPLINIEEGDEGFMIHMAVPGIEKDKIQLDVENEQLIIQSNIDNESDANENGKYLRKEYDYTSFRKVFNLNDDIDQANISAQLNNGVLTIILGLKEEAKPVPPRTITIN